MEGFVMGKKKQQAVYQMAQMAQQQHNQAQPKPKQAQPKQAQPAKQGGMDGLSMLFILVLLLMLALFFMPVEWLQGGVK
jgi:hypothetical protein